MDLFFHQSSLGKAGLWSTAESCVCGIQCYVGYCRCASIQWDHCTSGKVQHFQTFRNQGMSMYSQIITGDSSFSCFHSGFQVHLRGRCIFLMIFTSCGNLQRKSPWELYSTLITSLDTTKVSKQLCVPVFPCGLMPVGMDQRFDTGNCSMGSWP